MSTHTIGFYEDLTKNIFKLSSNTHLIYSSGDMSIYLNSVSLCWKYSLAFMCLHEKWVCSCIDELPHKRTSFMHI